MKRTKIAACFACLFVTVCTLALVPACAGSKPDVKPAETASAPAGGYVVVPAGTAEYYMYNPKNPDMSPMVSVVHGDLKKGPVTFFLRLKKGFRAPMHSHTSDYHSVIVEGEHKHWLPGDDESKLKGGGPGTYAFQPGGQVHGDECVSEGGCLILLSLPNAFDFVAAPNPPPNTDRGRYTHVAAGAATFAPLDPKNPTGVQAAFLFGGPPGQPLAMIMKLPAGPSGMHSHSSNYDALLMSGSHKHWIAGETEAASTPLAPKSYWFQPGQQVHGDNCLSPEGCTAYLVMPTGLDYIPAP